MELKLKICGIHPDRTPASIAALGDYLGFIFAEKSKRFIQEEKRDDVVGYDGVQRIGVFVNEKSDKILEIVKRCKLDLVQLHGDETPSFCQIIKENVPVIKAIPVRTIQDIKLAHHFDRVVDYVLFDTKGVLYGGNGIRFDWNHLNEYTGEVPFFLSGGIKLEHVDEILSLKHKQLFALDINSGFEKAPGEKNEDQIQAFRNKIFGNA